MGINTNYLVINGSDRKWYGDIIQEGSTYKIQKNNNFNRYNFTVYLKDMEKSNHFLGLVSLSSQVHLVGA